MASFPNIVTGRTPAVLTAVNNTMGRVFTTLGRLGGTSEDTFCRLMAWWSRKTNSESRQKTEKGNFEYFHRQLWQGNDDYSRENSTRSVIHQRPQPHRWGASKLAFLTSLSRGRGGLILILYSHFYTSEFCHIFIWFNSYLYYHIWWYDNAKPAEPITSGKVEGTGLVRRIWSLTDGKRSTADIHTECKNAEGTRNEHAALTGWTLFKH